MRVLLLEPYFAGSHKQWAEGLAKFSRHDIAMLTLSGEYWKWRMHGAAVTFARMLQDKPVNADVILATDMLDVAAFKGLAPPKLARLPIITYFHENQLTYPWSPDDRDVDKGRDRHYAWINFTTALASDRLLFNSNYHRDAFINALHPYLKAHPDHRELQAIEAINMKSDVIGIGLAPDLFDRPIPVRVGPLHIAWNHRWEYDKGPDDFFRVMTSLKNAGLEFRLSILGERFGNTPDIFQQAQHQFASELRHFGFISSREDYLLALGAADILPVTSRHDFFGISVLEAMALNVFPKLPKALAYPEHVPPEQHPQCYYRDIADLCEQVKTYARQPMLIRGAGGVGALTERHHWKQVAGKYDQFLDNLQP